ncbi:hypothetical protein WN51_13179 [Melipona quadrifasciata]|uniref:Uncharacterized protein n=1 Tax=Melipona quadrifasciata TaxID=166423 RepID=A0A0N0U5D7_9HYME|nr:hypothetical protein WN51_13179 [Melipona quadrifasciata]
MNDMKSIAILSMWLEFLSSGSDSASNCRRLGCRFRDEEDKMRNGEGGKGIQEKKEIRSCDDWQSEKWTK